jgi:hypothetical protein
VVVASSVTVVVRKQENRVDVTWPSTFSPSTYIKSYMYRQIGKGAGRKITFFFFSWVVFHPSVILCSVHCSCGFYHLLGSPCMQQGCDGVFLFFFTAAQR